MTATQIKQTQNLNHIVANSSSKTETQKDKDVEETETMEMLTKEEEVIKTEVLEETEEVEVNTIHLILTGINPNYIPGIQP